MRRISVTIAFLISTLFGFSQSYTTIHYSLSEGLPSNEVYEVFQDRNGFLWFTTDNGVVKYDGYEMVRLGVEDGLTDPVVFGIHEDQKGRIWFRTFSGSLSYYEDGIIHPYIYNNKLTDHITRSIISSIYVDSLDNLYFSTFRNKGVYAMIDAQGNVTAQYPGDALAYYFDVGTNGQLFGYQQLSLEFLLINGKRYHVPSLSYRDAGGCDIFSILPMKWKGKLYLALCSSIYEFDGSAVKTVFRGRGSIISLSRDQDDNLWVGYRSDGMDKFSSPDFTPTVVPQFLNNLSVTKVFQDNQKGLWFSTLEQGLFHLPNITIRNFEMPDLIKVQFVAASGKEVFIGTNLGTVYRASNLNQPEIVKKFKPPLKGLYIDKKERMWVTEAYTSYCFEPGDYDNPRSFFHSLTNATEDDKGNLYMVSGGAMVAVVDPTNMHIDVKQLSFMSRNLFVQDTSLFVVSRSGLHVTDLKISKTKAIPSLSEYKINRILKLNDSTLLITTIGRGFLVFDVNTHHFKNYNIKNRFVSNNIYAALLKDDYLWFGTENGLVKVELKSVFEDALNFELITKQNGLVSTQITHLACLDNSIWAFSDIGYSIVDTRRSHLSGHTPVFYLKEVKVNNESIALKDAPVNLAFDKNNILVNFGFISLDKEKVFIRHRLLKTQPWNYTTSRSLQFYSLSPATYRIEIEYSFDNTNWRVGYMSPAIIISQPFWKTWYFITGTTLLIILLTFLFFRNKMIVYRRHQQRLIQSEIQTIERERTRIAKDLHDSVGTDFSAIKMMVSQLLRKYQEPQAEEIESQFQNSIQEIKSIIYGLAPPGLDRYGLMTALNNYITRLNGKVQADITINTFGEEVKDGSLNISVFRIIQELISNSLKHADAKVISIHINSFGDLLNIVYEDDGKGFEWNGNHHGAGLFNIESRVQSVNGRLKFESNRYGVSYTIDIPLKKKETLSK